MKLLTPCNGGNIQWFLKVLDKQLTLFGHPEDSRKMLSHDQIEKLASVKSVMLQKNFFEQTEFFPKYLNFYCGDF